MCAVSYRKVTWNDEENYIHLCSMAGDPTYNFSGKKQKQQKLPKTHTLTKPIIVLSTFL